MDAFVTFDIDAEDDYDKCYEVIDTVFGLKPLSKNHDLALPDSTVMGAAPVGLSAVEFRDLFAEVLKANGIRPTRIAVIYAQDWAVRSAEHHAHSSTAKLRKMIEALEAIRDQLAK